MVTISGTRKQKNKDGKEFLILELQGDIELVQSSQTGRFYATVRRSSMPTTFDEFVANSLIGRQIPGDIVRVAAEPYKYKTESGEELTLSHRWVYQPEQTPAPVTQKMVAA